MAQVGSPLGEADLQQMQDHLDTLTNLQAEAVKAKSAGVPNMPDLEAQINTLRTQINKVKQAYFPGR